MVDRLARALFDMGRDVAARDVKGRTPSRPSSQVSSLLPPPPRLSLSNVLDTATSQVNRAVATPPQQNQPQRLNIPTVTERREEPEAWGVFETNYGPVAMPASWGEAGGYRQQGDLITDPQQLERAKNSNYAYTKLPEEQQKEIRMPVLEGRADNAVREVTGSVAGGIAPFIQQEAKKQLDAASRIGSGAVAGGIEKALQIRDELPEREEPQDEQAFAVVRNNQTNSTHLVRREDLEAAPEGTFTVITPNVNAQEAQSMMDAGLLQEGEAPVIRGPEDLGEQLDSADLASRFGIESFRNRQATEATREAPPEQRTAEYTLGKPNDLPEPPEGYAWAVRIDSPANAQPGATYPARLIPLVASPDGGWVVPENLGEGVMVVATPEGVAMPEAPRGPLDAALDVVNPIIEDPVGTIEAGISRLPGGEVLTNSTLPELIWGARYFIENVPVTGEPGGPTLSDIGTNIDEWKIPGTDTTIGDFRSGIWNLDIPGTQATIGDVVTAFVNYVQVPGDDAINVISDNLYEQFTGNEVDTETTGGGALSRIPLIGGFLENMYESGLDNDVSQGAAEAILGKPYVDWATQNQDTYVDIYENGYDLNGDGSVMITGADGVLTYWLNEEASAVEALYVLTFTDPLTIAGGIGAGGKWVARGGKIIRMADNAGPIRQTVGRITEGVGTAIHVAGRTGEAVGDLGLEYVLRGVTKGLEKTGIIAPSPGTRRSTDMTDAQEAAGGAIRQDRVTEEGDTIVVDDTGRVVEVEGADGTSREVTTADRRTVSEGEFPVGTGPEQEYYNSRIIRTEDGWEVQVLTDDGGWVTRTKAKTLDGARKWETRFQQRATTASGGGRWERAPQGTNSPKFIDNIPPDQYDALRAAIGDQWATSEDIMASIGRGTPLPEHALESSRIARVTIDTAEGIADGQPLPDWALNEAHYMNPHYEAMETAIRSAWSSPEGMGARSLLDGSGSVRRADGLTVRSSTPVISSEPLPRGRRRVSQKRIRAANNYVDMMHEHAKWHPESFRDGSFNEAWQRAVDLDYDLRQRGQRRSYNGVEREPLTAVRVPDGLMFTPEVQRGAARVTNEPGPSPQRAAEPEGETWTIEDPDSPRNNGRGYRITEDIWIEVTPVNASDVPTQWLRTYPDHRGRWYAAIVKGDNHTADNLIVTYAPTEAEALGLARETLRARGLIPGESGGLDVVADVNRASGDVVRMRTGPEQPRPHLTSRGLPKAGESREWNGIPVRAVDVDGETVYIFDTNDGPFAIRRENGKAVAVDPAAASEGRIVEMVWDGGRAINMRDAGRHIYRTHVQAETPAAPDVPAGDAVRAADAPEPVDATPDTPAPAEATTGAPRPRMTPETRRQRVARIRSSRKRQMREVRQSREAVVNARVRALYGEVTPEGGLRADVLAPPVRRFDPPEQTAPDPSGTFEMPRGETPDPEARPSWADPDVPAMSPEGQQAVLRGAQGKGSGRMPDSPDRSRGGPHRIKQKITAAKGQGERLSWNTNHFIQEQDGRAFWMKRPVTDDQVEALTRHTFRDGGDGDTLMERISIRSERYAANDNYRQDMTVYEYRALQDSLADYEKLLAEVHQNWGARQLRKGVAKLPEPARKSLEAVGRVLRSILGAWDSYINFARESMLFSHLRFLAYPSLQFFGNFGQMFLGGQFMAAIRGANPRTWLEYRSRILRSAKSVDDMIMLDPGASPYLKLQVELNMRPRREVREIYEGMFGSINDPLEFEKWLKKLNVPGATKIAKLKGSKIHAVHGAMIDAAFRDSRAYTSTMRLLRNEAVPDFRNMTQVRLMEWGFSRDEARRLWREFTDSYDKTVFNANDVRRFFEPHVGEGRAVRLQRDWQGALNKVDKLVGEDIKKYTFASPRTNADEFLGRVFIFHHFMARQSNYYANLVLRHPAMLNLYFNVKEQLENEGWPEFLNGWVPWFEAFGRQFFVNPTYALSSYLFFNDYGSTFEEEGQTRLGGALKWWDEKIGLSPAIMQAGNLFGLFGEDYAPNPLFIRRETNVLTTAINFGRAHGLLGDDPTPVGNVEEQFWLNVRERVSGLLPGTEQIEAIDVEARMDREINQIVADELAREDPNFDPDSPEGKQLISDVASDPDSPIYQRAVKRWVNGEVLEEALRIGVATFQPRNRLVNEEGEDLYHSFSRDVKDIVNVSDPRARELNLQADRYYDIGTERDREIAGLWNQVAFGHVHHEITVDGVTYSPAEIYRMNTEQRIALADGLLQEHGLLDDYKELQDERKRFLAQPENAEYAQFYTWRKEVNDYDGGVEKYWQDAIDGGNESARLYYEDVMSQPLTYEQRHQRLTSMYGFMQLKGYHTSVWDPAPVQMHGVFDPVNVANQAPQPIPYEEPNAEFRNEVRKAPEQLAELQEWDNKVKQVQSEMGIDPSIPFNELDTQTRIAIEEELEARGHKEPTLSWQVKKYVEWAEQQPPGADTSIEAFFEASDREYREGAPGRVQEKMNKPEPAPGPDRYGNQPTSSPSLWAEIDALLREHDHRYKPDDSSSSSGSSGSSGHWLLPYIN